MTEGGGRLFRSFWMGGFESACHSTRRGARLDMMHATQHDILVADDYRRLREVGIATARDTVRWHLVEATPGRYDFSSVEPFVAAARQHDVQVVWDLCHYGWPDGLDLFSPEFVSRFVDYCAAIARLLAVRLPPPRFYTPINDISFFSWAAGQVGIMFPFALGRGAEVKRQLVRAWIAAVDAIRHEDSGARFVAVEPLINVIAAPGHDEMAAAREHASQWEATDMLIGAARPELGGHPRYLDVLGVNFYSDNQWEFPGGRRIAWNPAAPDPRWQPLHRLLLAAHARYRRPLIIGETSHVGDGRAAWLREMSNEIALAATRGVLLDGVCLYPIIDRFSWDDPTHWHHSGLWDLALDDHGLYQRVLDTEYARALMESQQQLKEVAVDGSRLEIAGE